MKKLNKGIILCLSMILICLFIANSVFAEDVSDSTVAIGNESDTLEIDSSDADQEDATDKLSIKDDDNNIIEKSTQNANDNVKTTSNDGNIYSKNTNAQNYIKSQTITHHVLINDDTVHTYENVTFRDCHDERGGAIYVVSGGIVLKDCTFIDNYATGSSNIGGGAIHIGPGCSAVITDCTFENNHAKNGNGGAISVYADHVKITNCKFIKNYETHEYGGAIFWSGTHGEITKCTFNSNHGNDGGAIKVQSSATALTINSCTFKGNQAVDGSGGAIDWVGKKGVIKNSKFISNKADEDGGAIYWNGPEGTIAGCEFSSNHAGDDGGALKVTTQGSYVKASTLKFNKNVAALDGGAINWGGAHGSIAKATITNNKATGYGGGIKIAATAVYVKITDSTVKKNQVTKYDGGGISSCGKCLSLKNVNVIANSAHEEGGGLEVSSSPGHAAASAALTNCKFTSNKAGTAGGGVFTGVSNFKITKCTFTKNNSPTGGALYVQGKTTLVASVFKSNKAKWGGAVFVAKTLVASTNEFKSNYASTTGGAILVKNGVASFKNNKFISNTGKKFAGAIGTTKSTVLCKGDVFYKNKASTSSGAILVQAGCKLTAGACYFIGNTAKYYKDISNSGKASVNNNWWGNTLKNKKAAPRKSKVKGVKVKKWLVLKVTHSKLKVTVDLRYNQQNKKVGNQGTKIPVKFKVSNGAIKANYLNKGVKTVKLTKKVSGKKSSVTAIVYGIKSKPIKI